MKGRCRDGPSHGWGNRSTTTSIPAPDDDFLPSGVHATSGAGTVLDGECPGCGRGDIKEHHMRR